MKFAVPMLYLQFLQIIVQLNYDCQYLQKQLHLSINVNFITLTYYEKIVCTSKKQLSLLHTLFGYGTSDICCGDGVALNTGGEGEGEGRANIGESW